MDKQALYRIADTGFFIFHVLLIFFNLFGWIPRRLRKWNLVTLGLTALSWVGLGIFYGFGYCFLTDWHWTIREKLSYTTTSDSYIHFLVTELTGMSVSESFVDTLTIAFFLVACAASIVLNVRDRRRRGGY